MPKTRIPSPARSQGAVTTPKRKKSRGSRSLCSPALSTASGRLTSLIDQFKDKNMESFALSPLNGRSVLNDNTEIEEPTRKSWWKKLDENSQDVLEVLGDNKQTDVNNVIEELIDIDVLSQEKKNYTLDLPESSDNESINSIVLPQRKLFTQKENQPQKKFGQLVGNRETLAKLHKTNTTNVDKTVDVGTRELFQNAKRSKPIFPAALLNISPNKTAADKTKENIIVEPKPRVRNIFGNRPANKRKNIFADFIASESEDEIPDIQPKVFAFQKKLEQRRISSVSKGRDGSPTSSITTDMEMDDWKLLPSSTMVENQLEEMVAGHTPVKRARLSKLSEAKESDAGTNTLQTNTTADKTKQSNKSVSSKNKSKTSPEIRDTTLNNSRTTRSMLKNASKREENVNTPVKQAKDNKSQNKTSKDTELDVSTSKPVDVTKQNTTLNKSQRLNKSRTRNSPKAAENEIESEVNITVKAINNETRVINKSTNKKLNISTVANKSLNELNTDKENINTNKTQNKQIDTDPKAIEQNDQEDDENNFTLAYENDDNEVVEEVAAHSDNNKTQKDNFTKQKTFVIEKDNEEKEINKSKINKSISSNKSIKKPAITVEESVESQTEQHSADNNVDGNVEQEKENDKNEASQIIDEVENHSREDTNNENANANLENEGENNDDELNVSQDNEPNKSREEANKSQIDEDAVNESDQNEGTNASDGNEEEDKSHEVEGSENEEEADESQEVYADANESQEVEEEADESQEVDEEANESQEVDEEANESQEVEEEDNESQEVEDENIQEDEEANESENEASAYESEEVDNNEESHADSEPEANESQEVDDEQEMDDSDEADRAIASDPENSDQDDQAEEMEVDDENVDESEQNNQQSEIEPSAEEIEESPNVTHDTTGRNRKKDLNKSPEAILHDNTNQMDSFTAKGRNTSIRKTTMIKNLNIRPSLAPPRDSTGFSDGTRNSSAEGSGWDSHRTTRKTLRQTFGKDFTPRKSLRALVMEKSAKRQTQNVEMHSETVKYPQANSTELPEDSNHYVEDVPESDHEVSRRTRQTTLEMYLQKIKQQNIEKKLKMEEAVRNSLKGPVRDTLSLFKVPNKPAPRRPKPAQTKPKKQIKSIIPFDELPSEVIEDMKYKPPKRFQPTNASWITKRLYKFLENKLEPKYDYKARIRAEKLVETIYHFAKDLRRHDVAPTDSVEVLKHELARLDVVHTHFEFYEFFHEFMPREVRVKVVPDVVNKIPLPRHGVFSDILRGNTVQG